MNLFTKITASILVTSINMSPLTYAQSTGWDTSPNLSSTIVVAPDAVNNSAKDFKIIGNVDTDNDGTADTAHSFMKGNNIHMLFGTVDSADTGEGNVDNYANHIIYEHATPAGTCMDGAGLPKIQNSQKKSRHQSFSYSTDNGKNWVEYTQDSKLPTECNITNFRLQNPDIATQYEYILKVADDFAKDTLVDELTGYTKNKTSGEKGDETKTTSNTFVRAEKIENGKTCSINTVTVNVPKKPEPPKPTTPPTPTTPTVPEEPKTGGGGGLPPVPPTPTTPTTPTPVTPTVPVTPEVPTTPTTPSVPSTPVEIFTLEEEPEDPDVKDSFKKIPRTLPRTGVNYESAAYFHNHKYTSHLVETRVFKDDFRLAGNKNTELSHWLQVLPEEDHNSTKYLVIPTIGLVMPINTVDKNDKAYDSFLNGNDENFYNYLHNGAVELPGSTNKHYGQIGNKVIGGHSSFWKNSTARYKTHFQKIIGLEKDTEIWVYEKNASGKFDRFVYKTTDSYNTKPTNTSILKNNNKSELTLFTCTPIGGFTGRWIVTSEFVGKY